MGQPVNYVYANTNNHWSHRTKMGQRPPFVEPLAYYMREHRGWGEAQAFGDSGDWPVGVIPGYANMWAPENEEPSARLLEDLHSQVYDSFKDKLGDSASWGETAGQVGKTWDGMVDRLRQAGDFIQHVRHGRFGLAARTLRTPVPSGVSHRKAFAQNFLEYHLGWEPLVKDIYSSMKFLDEPLPRHRVVASGRTRLEHKVVLIDDHDQWGNVSFLQRESIATFRLRLQAEVAISNPNLYLLNRMGMVNPFLIAWQLVPYSFVVDWFINLEQVIGSYTDFFGLTLTRACSTLSYLDGYFVESRTQAWGADVNRPPQGGGSTRRYAMGAGMWRTTGVQTPSLHVRGFNGFSPIRGATAAALVISGLGR